MQEILLNFLDELDTKPDFDSFVGCYYFDYVDGLFLIHDKIESQKTITNSDILPLRNAKASNFIMRRSIIKLL